MTGIPAICAITVNFRNATDTAACVASLLVSAAPVDVVVVDNSPNDPELAAALAPYPQVTLVTPVENLGFGRGNNLGVRTALAARDYAFVFLLNNDATVALDAIGHLLAATQAHPAASVFAPRVVLAENPQVLWYGGGEVNWRRAAAKVPGWLGPADGATACQSRAITFASGCAMLVRSATWRALDGFDPRFFMYEEDLELCLRVAELGQGLWYEATATVFHRGQGSQQTGGAFRAILSAGNPNLPFFAYHVTRNRILNARLHARGSDRASATAGLVVLVVSKLVRFAARRRGGAIISMLRGIRDGLRA